MPRAVRHINEVRILDSLYRTGATTRAELARVLDLMRSTVGNLIGGMIEQGLVTEGEITGSTPGGRTGRPGQLVQLNAGHSVFIGADIGVGHISVVAIDLTGSPVISRSAAIEAPSAPADETVDALVALLRTVIKKLPDRAAIRGICVTVPGHVDRSGMVLRAPVLGWKKVPIQRCWRPS